jgi:hypothetical protein
VSRGITVKIYIWPHLFQRWVIVSADDTNLAWTGAAWVRHVHYFAGESSRIVNFGNYSAAVEYVSKCEALSAETPLIKPCRE